MKKVFFLLFAIFATLIISSCENDSLEPIPVKVEGLYVMLNVQQPSLDFNDLDNAAFKATLTCPANNVARYELFIRRRSADGITSANFVLFETITSFPHQLNITPSRIASALNLNVSDLQDGDIYRFIAYSYDVNGNRAGYNDLTALLRTTETMKQGYKWSANLTSSINPALPFNYYAPFSLN